MNPDGRGADTPYGVSLALSGTAGNGAHAAGPLSEALARKRNTIIKEWLAQTLQSYPAHTSRFLAQEKDPFRNPVGDTLRRGLPILFDQIVGDIDISKPVAALDDIIKIRAVQDFTASQAVSFVFLLKNIAREALAGELRQDPGSGWELLETRIDKMALHAFDIFENCRDKMLEIRVNEVKRRMYLLERMHSAFIDRRQGESGS